ncbi:MAG: sulfur carrier protein ThiS [Syntrophorhabdaceae bacterium]|nr:sulfur carrier protein ThiS [Syntrophorhabdaceae bacterium]
MAPAAQIEIILNGLKEKVPEGTTIAELIRLSGEADKHLVVECNNRFIHPHAYPATTVNKDDKVEFINPDFGG